MKPLVRYPRPVKVYEQFWNDILLPFRVPRLVKEAPVGPLLPTDDQILGQLKELGARVQAGEEVPVTLNLEDDNAFQNTAVAKIPPFVLGQPEDTSLEGFYARVRKQLGGTRFQIYTAAMLTKLQQEEVRRFSRPRIGMVGVRYVIEPPILFLGDYNSGFYGVHVDDFVCLFPLCGRKAIRLWNDDYVSEHPGLRNALSFEEHLTSSTLLEAKRGDVIFWPERFWHVNGTNDRTFRVSMSLRCKANDSPACHAANATFTRLRQDSTRGTDVATLEGVVAESVTQLNTLYDEFAERRSQSIRDLLCILSNDGFTNEFGTCDDEAQGDEDLAFHEFLFLAPEVTFMSIEQHDSLTVAVNGKAVSVPSSPAVRFFLTSLAEEEPVTLEALDSEFGGFDIESVNSVLTLLIASGALSRREL